jgi:hypothetical protein
MARILDHTFKATGAWFGKSGRTIYEWSTRNGRQYDHSHLQVRAGSASVSAEPAEGTVGHLDLVVNWSYGWFGKSDYRIRAYDAEIPADSLGLSETRSSHMRTHEGNWSGASGVDKIPFKIPTGFRVQAISINVQAGQAEITNLAGLVGSTRSIEVKVSWSYGWFGRVGYYVTVLLVNSDLSLAISAPAVDPDPGVAGEEINIAYTITNAGSAPVERVSEVIEIYALHLDDLSDVILNGLSDEERTSELSNEEIVLNLSSGDHLNRNTSLVIPGFASPENHITSAGTYRVTLRLELGGVTLVDSTINSFRVVAS